MKHIRMLADRCGSEDGFTVRYFKVAQNYWVAEGLACRFIRCGEAIGITAEITNMNVEKIMTAASRRLLKRTTEPASEPLTLAETKLYLRVDGSEEDALINECISAARQYAEHFLKRSLITQSWKLVMDTAFPQQLLLPMGPVQAVTSVVTFDETETQTIVATSLYCLNAAQDALVFSQAVSGHRVEARYQAGYGNAADIPKPVRQGMLIHIAQMYENRGEQNLPIPVSALALYQPYRWLVL